MVGIQFHTYGECSRAYGGYCREIKFRWSEFDFTLPLLCRRLRRALPRLRRVLPRNTNSDGQNSISHYRCYVDKNLPYPCYVDIEFRCAPRNKAWVKPSRRLADSKGRAFGRAPQSAERETSFAFQSAGVGEFAPKAQRGRTLVAITIALGFAPKEISLRRNFFEKSERTFCHR